MPLGGTTPTARDNDALLAATLLRHSLVRPADAERVEQIRAEAIAVAKSSLGAVALEQGGTYDDFPATRDVDVVRLLAQRTEHASWLCLAQHLLESATQIADGEVDRGRILAQLAGNSRKRGYLDLAEAQAEELLRMARRERSAELAVRALDQLGALAQTRGNFGVMRQHLQKEMRLARKAGLTRMVASAHSGMGFQAAVNGQYGEAATHFWTAYNRVGGVGNIARGALVNLAQTLLVSGRPLESRKIASLLLAQSPPLQSALPALSGYALSSARLGDTAGVDWACGQVRQLARSRHHPRDVAAALIECAAALDLMGRAPQSGVLRRRAEALAVEFGFHDLTFNEALARTFGLRVDRQPFSGAAERVETDIAAIEPPTLPTDVDPVFV